MDDCLFCRSWRARCPAEIVHETDKTVAFHDIAPAAPVHVLVVPRPTSTTPRPSSAEHGEVLAAMVLAAREVADAAGMAAPERGYRLVFNVGPDSFNSVPHLHLHVIGGEPPKGHRLDDDSPSTTPAGPGRAPGLPQPPHAGLLGQQDELLRVIEPASPTTRSSVQGNRISAEGPAADPVVRLFDELVRVLQSGRASTPPRSPAPSTWCARTSRRARC